VSIGGGTKVTGMCQVCHWVKWYGRDASDRFRCTWSYHYGIVCHQENWMVEDDMATVVGVQCMERAGDGSKWGSGVGDGICTEMGSGFNVCDCLLCCAVVAGVGVMKCCGCNWQE